MDMTDIQFGTVKFIQPCQQTLAIANTGQVPVQFEFIQKPGQKSYCKPWLKAEPSSGFIMPGIKAEMGNNVLGSFWTCKRLQVL